ncbi:MAG: hypothetical protein JNL24_01090 [Bacteroidia bacterium]|jgi:hypothetical protein|nr:hypothetical protein [Bacteroidia bacterium]
MKTIITTTLFIFYSGLSVFGQTDSTEFNKKQFHSYFGIQVPTLTELNNSLEANNYPKLNENNFSIGLGMIQMTKKKVIFQQELNVYSQTQSNDSISTSLRSVSFGQSLFGYSYIQNENFQMYSLFGLTYFNTTLKVTHAINNGTTFNNYSSTTGNQLEMTTNNFLANISTHFNYLIKLPNTKNRLILGVRAAYYLPFDNSKWLMGKTELSESPNINPGGYALNFVLGFSY